MPSTETATVPTAPSFAVTVTVLPEYVAEAEAVPLSSTLLIFCAMVITAPVLPVRVYDTTSPSAAAESGIIAVISNMPSSMLIVFLKIVFIDVRPPVNLNLN